MIRYWWHAESECGVITVGEVEAEGVAMYCDELTEDEYNERLSRVADDTRTVEINEMSDAKNIDARAALQEVAKSSRAHAEVLKSAAQVMEMQAASLTLLAGEIVDSAPAVDGATPAAAPDKPKRGRPAATTPTAPPAPPAATLEQAQAKIRELVAVKGGDQAKAVLARNGVVRVSEAKPEHFAKIIADAAEAIAGKDFNASSDASPFD